MTWMTENLHMFIIECRYSLSPSVYFFSSSKPKRKNGQAEKSSIHFSENDPFQYKHCNDSEEHSSNVLFEEKNSSIWSQSLLIQNYWESLWYMVGLWHVRNPCEQWMPNSVHCMVERQSFISLPFTFIVCCKCTLFTYVILFCFDRCHFFPDGYLCHRCLEIRFDAAVCDATKVKRNSSYNYHIKMWLIDSLNVAVGLQAGDAAAL